MNPDSRLRTRNICECGRTATKYWFGGPECDECRRIRLSVEHWDRNKAGKDKLSDYYRKLRNKEERLLREEKED